MLLRLALLLVIVGLVGCGTTTTKHDFTLDAEKIASAAAEGSLMAGDVADGRTTSAFTKVHAGELAALAAELRDTLRRSTSERGLPTRRLALLAGRVADRLDRVASRPRKAEALRLMRELARDSRRASRLGAQA